MEFHKPKPWHGARELLKEIGVIVIGVLIALGARPRPLSSDQRATLEEECRWAGVPLGATD